MILGHSIMQGAQCCGRVHPFDERHVERDWWPSTLRLLIVGETPSPNSAYFYDPIPEHGPDSVGVRRNLLGGLAQRSLIAAPSLAAFKEAGLLFDHAVRCRLSKAETKRERRRARHLASERAHRGYHLSRALREAGKVWIMGWLALDAVARARGLGALPSVSVGVNPPRAITEKFFVSRYLLHASRAEMADILDRFRAFVAA
ncbi:MAG: hypothetical protein HY727_05680 [Candidatus Rokubacteria bacterium]|nr:hypothetical protein [Candidatus Rokubacteria bacterium]